MDLRADAHTDHRAEDGDNALAHVLADFPKQCVLVLGDVMLDRYVLGEVRRISPEAPIPVLRAEQRRAVPGGAANVARNVASMGARAILIGAVGDRPRRHRACRLLAAIGGIDARLATRHARPDDGEDAVHVGRPPVAAARRGRSGAVEGALEHGARPLRMRAARGGGVVVLSDYAKGVLTDRVLGARDRTRRARPACRSSPTRSGRLSPRIATRAC